MVLENIPYLFLLEAATFIRIRDFENSVSRNSVTNLVMLFRSIWTYEYVHRLEAPDVLVLNRRRR
jgi:hypothetical protein